MEAYEDATSSLHGYLVVDCDPKSPRELKLRTNIFPGEQTVCYLKKRKWLKSVIMISTYEQEGCFLQKITFFNC